MVFINLFYASSKQFTLHHTTFPLYRNFAHLPPGQSTSRNTCPGTSYPFAIALSVPGFAEYRHTATLLLTKSPSSMIQPYHRNLVIFTNLLIDDQRSSVTIPLITRRPVPFQSMFFGFTPSSEASFSRGTSPFLSLHIRNSS